MRTSIYNHDNLKKRFFRTPSFISVLTFNFILAGVGIGTGCSSIAEQVIAKPSVGLEKVDVRDVGISGATVVFNVKVGNPNSFGLQLSKLTYAVDIGGKALATGVIDKGLTIAANQDSIVELPIPVRYSDVFASAFDVLKSGTSTYRVRGAAAIGPFSLPFDESGDIKLTK